MSCSAPAHKKSIRMHYIFINAQLHNVCIILHKSTCRSGTQQPARYLWAGSEIHNKQWAHHPWAAYPQKSPPARAGFRCGREPLFTESSMAASSFRPAVGPLPGHEFPLVPCPPPPYGNGHWQMGVCGVCRMASHRRPGNFSWGTR